MKEIKAYVHRNRVADVITALKAAPSWAATGNGNAHNLTVYAVKGSLVPLYDDELHYSLDLGDEIVNEYKLELLCEDAEVDELVSVIRTAAHTGQANAGWVTVCELVQAVPIT